MLNHKAICLHELPAEHNSNSAKTVGFFAAALILDEATFC
jgi:hypothetical protein